MNFKAFSTKQTLKNALSYACLKVVMVGMIQSRRRSDKKVEKKTKSQAR